MARKDNNPLQMQMAMLTLMADSTRTFQTQWLQAMTGFVAQMPGMVTWKTIDVPVPTGKLALNEEQMREAFQMAADLNLSAWTQAANVLSAMPRWAHWPNEVPGRLFTDMFHSMQTAAKWNGASDQ
ncbi:MAG: hypothetical protein AAF950_03830 [Pseudomonadota bacterium]